MNYNFIRRFIVAIQLKNMGDNLVDYIETYRRKSPLTFWYGGPFVVLYAIWFYYWSTHFGIDEYWELGCIVTAVIGLLQV
jgi:hypothetical protein